MHAADGSSVVRLQALLPALSLARRLEAEGLIPITTAIRGQSIIRRLPITDLMPITGMAVAVFAQSGPVGIGVTCASAY
jgi:hypothetical protein